MARGKTYKNISAVSGSNKRQSSIEESVSHKSSTFALFYFGGNDLLAGFTKVGSVKSFIASRSNGFHSIRPQNEEENETFSYENFFPFI